MTNVQIILKSLIEQEFKENNNDFSSQESFFEFFSAKLILKNIVISDEEIIQGIKGAGNDGGCDSIYLFCNGILVKEDFLENKNIPMDSKLDLIIIQSKTSTKFGEDAIMKWKTVSSNLLDFNNKVEDFSSRYNKDVRDSFQLFREIYTALIRKRIKLSFYYYYASEGVEIHPNVISQGSELECQVKSLFPQAKVFVDYFGADKLMNIISEPIIQDFELVLADTPISLGHNKDYVALVSLKEYYKFITNNDHELIQSIFESNIRDYQGNVTVNKEIQKTLNENKTDDFWWLNNGITILASNITPVTNKQLLVSEPEIVNGLQTSNEIYNYFSEHSESLDSDSRNVLLRLIVPNDESSRDGIILATNNQTTIPKSSLRASDSIHWQIEIYFKQRGLFYDRRKNFYKNSGKKISEIVSVSYLAQSLIAVLLQKPNYSRARPSTLLTDDEYYNFLYDGKIEISIYYTIIIWANRIKLYLKSCNKYDAVTQGDLLFYILYYSFAKSLSKSKITPDDIKTIDIEILSPEKIEEYTEHVNSIYQSNGGNAKTAKSSVIIDALISEF